MFVGALLIRTADFKLAYRLMKAMRSRGIDFLQIAANQPLPEGCLVWFGTPEEVSQSNIGLGVACSLGDVNLAIERAVHLSVQRDPAELLSFGVDPGPRPGLAWNVDGRPLGVEQMEDVDATIDRICDLKRSIPHRQVVVRVGDGSPTIGARMANVCIARGIKVEMVDEHSTSIGLRRHEHRAAAARIAMIPGVEVQSKKKVKPSEGEVREVQRMSRRESQGRITLPIDLAQAVAVGRLSMQEAIETHSSRSSPLEQ
tara:strand:- start:750 stop:1520 length:771 start_codon:yes stop_codon:yes gene_type:complete